MPRQITTAPEARGRRDFLKVLGGGALASALAFNRLSAAAKPGSKPMRGLFPIGSRHSPIPTNWTWSVWRRKSSF